MLKNSMGKFVVYDKAGGYSGWLGNVMFQTASTIGIAIKNNMNFIFPYKEYFDAFVPTLPTSNAVLLEDFNTVDYIEPNFHYNDVVLSAGSNHNLKGYYQSEKYFKHCEVDIRRRFTFNDAITRKIDTTIVNLKKSFNNRPIVAIHIRMGDYVKLQDNYVCLIN